MILLTGARLWDPDTDFIADNVNILIEGTLIREITDQPIKTEAAINIDVENRFVLPGLIDAHVHVIANASNLNALANLPPYLVAARAKSTLEAMLMRGFTTVRDAGGADQGLVQAIEEGHFIGPRLFVSGLALAHRNGHGDYRAPGEANIGCPACRGFRSITRLVEDQASILRAVREEMTAGANQIKIMASGGLGTEKALEECFFEPEEIETAVQTAKGAGSYVMAHAYASDAVRRCIKAGVKSIEHGTLIDADTAALMTERGSFLVPTLGVFVALRDQARQKGHGKTRADRLDELLQQSLAGLDIARSAGVHIGHGSDHEGATQHLQSQEFAVRAEVMTPREILRAATQTNALIMGLSDELGSLTPGKRADLLVVDGDPLIDVSVLADPRHRLRLIMKDGQCFKNELS